MQRILLGLITIFLFTGCGRMSPVKSNQSSQTQSSSTASSQEAVKRLDGLAQNYSGILENLIPKITSMLSSQEGDIGEMISSFMSQLQQDQLDLDEYIGMGEEMLENSDLSSIDFSNLQDILGDLQSSKNRMSSLEDFLKGLQ